MTFVPAAVSTFQALMMGAATSNSTIGSGNTLAAQAIASESVAVSSFTEIGPSAPKPRLVPVPGAMWKAAPEVDESPVIASMGPRGDLNPFHAPANGSKEDHTAAIIFAAAILLVSMMPLAMTFSMRAKQILSNMLGIGAVAESKAQAKPEPRESSSKINPVRIGGEHAPGASMMPPPRHIDQYGKKGIH